ncbi:MAG: SUF system NifU family Fe-S cluster assembly protein, partial [Phycisphaerae bacterium]|nr:SUF system NifU family Fe-S cluster assembly protein [Phycisphaerae bacterium]
MTAEEIELDRSMLSDHAARPRNCRALLDATTQAHGHNAICGDKLTLWLKIEGAIIGDASFQASGCSISTASSSMLTEAVKGKTIDEANELFERFHNLLTSSPDAEFERESLGKLAAFQGVRKYPIRVKCATLAWHA